MGSFGYNVINKIENIPVAFELIAGPTTRNTVGRDIAFVIVHPVYASEAFSWRELIAIDAGLACNGFEFGFGKTKLDTTPTRVAFIDSVTNLYTLSIMNPTVFAFVCVAIGP